MEQNAPHDTWLSAAECATQTGLTVRALRLYEQHGLISPRRTGKNWRLYGRKELERLNEIITLKSLGLPLTRIAKLLSGTKTDFASLLSLQHATLLRLRESADQGLSRIETLRAEFAKNGTLDLEDIIQLTKEIAMTQINAESVAWKRYEQTRPRIEVQLPQSQLDEYVGYYELSDNSVIEVVKLNSNLTAQLTGQPAIEIYAEGEDKFFYKVVTAQVTFERDTKNNISTLILHQDGFEREAIRITEAQALTHRSRLQSRIDSNTPFPGSREALDRLINEATSGKNDWSWRSLEFRLATENWTAGMQRWLAQLGDLETVTFDGVNTQGWDVYHAKFKNGAVKWSFMLDQHGILQGELIQDIPK
jgi:DNA-binding transcriptional MerR regulator